MVIIHQENRRPTDKSKKAGKFLLKNKGFHALLTFMWYEVQQRGLRSGLMIVKFKHRINKSRNQHDSHLFPIAGDFSSATGCHLVCSVSHLLSWNF
jgi:hypothetical protein